MSASITVPIQISLRVRHPSMDPEHISAALELKPEHCFRAGDFRSMRAAGQNPGQHTQSYWLAPVSAESSADAIEPEFLATIAEKHLGRTLGASAEDLQAATRNLRSRSVESVLLHFLQRLSSRQPFLQRIRSEGGDVSLLMLVERESVTDFTLPVSIARLLANLGVEVEFKFDT